MKKEKYDCGEWSVKKENGEILIAGDRYIARVYDWAGYNPPASKENAILHDEAEANARLIAAAPELLERLTDIISFVKKDLKERNIPFCFTGAEDAIKKALGE